MNDQDDAEAPNDLELSDMNGLNTFASELKKYDI